MMHPYPEADLQSSFEKLANLIIAAAPPMENGLAEIDLGESDILDLERLLACGSYLSIKSLSEAKLDLLRRKIEVAPQIYQSYKSDLSLPMSDEPLSAAGVNQLCAVMLLASIYRHDARFLNSALKLIDFLSSSLGKAATSELAFLAQATLDALIPFEGPQ